MYFPRLDKNVPSCVINAKLSAVVLEVLLLAGKKKPRGTIHSEINEVKKIIKSISHSDHFKAKLEYCSQVEEYILIQCQC
jgi:hypothetical protein